MTAAARGDAAPAVPGIDLKRLTTWLGEHVPELAAPHTLVRIGDGQSNLTYRLVDSAGSAVVLRRPPLGEILASAHDMSREYRILAALAGAGAPAPRPQAFCADDAICGAPFYVMEHVDGLVLSTVAAARSIPPEARQALSLEMATTLAGLHALDLDALGLQDFRRPESLAERQLRRWTRQWHASKTRELPLIDELSAHFGERLPVEHEQTLVHGDFHLSNVVVGPGGTVRAVLDWELCTVGDPLADVGLMVAYWNESSAAAREPSALFREAVTALPGFVRADELVTEYARVARRDVADVGFWIAFAYWKVAIIVEGIYRRWLNDPANGSDAGTLRPAVDRLASLAAAAAEHTHDWSEVDSAGHPASIRQNPV